MGTEDGISNTARAIALSLGLGRFTTAPGTLGALGALPLFAALRLTPPWFDLIALGGLFGLGVWACDRVARDLSKRDPSCVVFDETWGMLAVLLAIPESPVWMLVGFAAFRSFDILKPGPIGWIDRRVGGGIGIMSDDAAAALAAIALTHGAIWIVEYVFPSAMLFNLQ